jgi:hypothetical protein
MLANPGHATASQARPGTIGRLRQVYHDTVVEKGRAEGFLIPLSYIVMSLVIRAITHAIRDRRFSFLFHNMSPSSGLHIHHMVFGILGLLAIGFIAVAFRPKPAAARYALAVGYGIAAALTLDEFALWLRLDDVYWSPQGKESVDALLLAGAVFLLAMQGLDFWGALWRDVTWLLSKRNGPYPNS